MSGYEAFKDFVVLQCDGIPPPPNAEFTMFSLWVNEYMEFIHEIYTTYKKVVVHFSHFFKYLKKYFVNEQNHHTIKSYTVESR